VCCPLSWRREPARLYLLDQYLAMVFAQLTYRESLRDIEACLGAMRAKLYHMGFRSRVRRSTLADANDAHDWRIYADFAQVLIATARPLYAAEPMGVELEQSLYALDSTTIDLCLSLFPWARFRKHKAAVKMHTLLDLRGNIPAFIHITNGKVHDVNVLDQFLPESGAFYVMDRGYIDFERLYRFTLESAFFVSAPKPTSCCGGATRTLSIRRPACVRIKPSFLPRWNRPRSTQMRCARLAMWMRRPASSSCF